MTDPTVTPTPNGTEATASNGAVDEQAKAKAAAYNAALNRLREANRSELDGYIQEEFEKRGLVWHKRLTDAEKAEKALTDLLSSHPELRAKLAEAQPTA